jgi:hypothetical protein
LRGVPVSNIVELRSSIKYEREPRLVKRYNSAGSPLGVVGERERFVPVVEHERLEKRARLQACATVGSPGRRVAATLEGLVAGNQ